MSSHWGIEAVDTKMTKWRTYPKSKLYTFDGSMLSFLVGISGIFSSIVFRMKIRSWFSKMFTVHCPERNRTFLWKDGVLLNFQKDVGIRNIKHLVNSDGICVMPPCLLPTFCVMICRVKRWQMIGSSHLSMLPGSSANFVTPLVRVPACLAKNHPSHPGFRKSTKISISRYVFLIFF